MKTPPNRTKQTAKPVSSEPTGNYVTMSPEGYVEIVAIGDQTPQTIEKVSQEGAALVRKVTKGDPEHSRQLVDISRSGSYSSESNKAAMKVIEFLEYERVAIFGGSHLLNDVINMVIMLMGKGGKIKTFDTRDEAVAWLSEPRKPLGA